MWLPSTSAADQPNIRSAAPAHIRSVPSSSVSITATGRAFRCSSTGLLSWIDGLRRARAMSRLLEMMGGVADRRIKEPAPLLSVANTADFRGFLSVLQDFSPYGRNRRTFLLDSRKAA